MSKRYKVVGTAPILGHQPGETFEANLDPGEVAFFFQIGALEVVKSLTPAKESVEDKIRHLNVESHKKTK